MNHASATVSGRNSGPRTYSDPSEAMLADQGDGRGTDRSCAANSGVWAFGAGVPTGRVNVKSPSSGTQISLQTSQLACAFNITGTVARTVTGSKNSPV